MEEVVTLPRKVLKNLGTYLTGTLRVDKDFISSLSAAGLLGDSDADRLVSSVTQGGNEALYGLLHYMEWYYDEEMLERFCAFLEEKSKSAKPIFSEIAERIRGEMKRYQPHPTQPAETQQDVPGPSGSVPEFNAKSFMDKYKERFLRCVHTPSIATRLKVDHVIPEVLYSEIDQRKITASEASEKLFLHLRSHAVPDTIHHLCDVMAGEEDYPLMKKLGEDMKKDKDLPPSSTGPLPMESSTPHPSGTTQDDVLRLSATQGEPTPTVSTMDERSQKIEEIVDMYRSESTKVSLPEIPELEDDFDDMMGTLNAKLSSADPQVICKLVGMVRLKYRRYIHGVKPGKVPSIPNTASGLCEFISEKSTPYEILLVHHAIEALDMEDLKGTLQSYECNLGDHLRLTLKSYKKRNVTLPLRKDHTYLAIVLSKEQILLSLVLHIKEYLMKYLQLEETIFEGFGEGCTVLFYSILKVDAVLLAPKMLSHSAELKRMFDVTHLVVFDYFACDVERATIELLDSQGTALLKAETALERTRTSLDEAQMNSEQLEHQLIVTTMKQKVKEEEIQKENEMFKRTTVILARQKDELEEKLRQLAVEKEDEVDSMLKVLRTKLEELEGEDFLPLILERDKREAVLKEEIATLKTTLEEKELQLRNTLHQKDAQLQQKDAQVQQKDAQLGEHDAQLKQQHTVLQQKDDQLKQKDAELRQKDEESGRQYAILLQEYQQLQQEHDQLRRERDQLQREISRSLSAKPVVKKPPRNWEDMKCQKILECGGWCRGVAIKGNHIAVGVHNQIKVYDRSSTDLLHIVGTGQLSSDLNGVIFYDPENILVSDSHNGNIEMFTIQGRHVRTIDRGSTTFSPYGITISPDGYIYVCDAANDCVCVFDVNGKFLFSFGSFGSGDECFYSPVDLCFASDGFLYITDVGNSRICIYDKDGKFSRKFTTAYQPWCIDATDCGHLIVSPWVSDHDEVMIYTTGGDLVHVFGEHGSELGQFIRPFGVSVDSDGLIYIADCYNHRIQVL